jgi:hypothetical protein
MVITTEDCEYVKTKLPVIRDRGVLVALRADKVNPSSHDRESGLWVFGLPIFIKFITSLPKISNNIRTADIRIWAYSPSMHFFHLQSELRASDAIETRLPLISSSFSVKSTSASLLCAESRA